MADVEKTVKVVSRKDTSEVNLFELTQSGVDTDSLEIHSNTDQSDLTLNLPSPDDGTSLQELIESELALRKSQFSDQIETEIIPSELDDAEAVESLKSPIPPCQIFGQGDYEGVDINTQFLLAERNHSFQSFTGNDMFFFNTVLDDPPVNGTDFYSKDEQDLHEQGVEEQDIGDPTDSVIYPEDDVECPVEVIAPSELIEGESSPDVPHESSESDVSDSSVIKEGVDLITLSSFDPFTTIVDSSKSEPIDNPDIVETPSSECADSDFICLQPDPVIESSQNLDENLVNGDLIEAEEEGNVVFVTNEIESIVSNCMEVLQCDDSALIESLGKNVVNVFETVEIDDDDLPISPEDNPLLTIPSIPEIDIIPPDDSEISDSELVCPDDGFDTWTTVEEQEEETGGVEDTVEEVPVLSPVHESSDSSSSQSEKSETMTTTKTEKKSKKKKSEGGESTKTKKTKKTKKSDEKENISVNVNGMEPQLTPEECSPSPADVSILDSDLSSVSVKELKQTYCSEARKSFKTSDSPELKELISTGISIKELRRSFGDLSSLCDKDEGVRGARGEEMPPISTDMKARSMGDLHRISDSFRSSLESDKMGIHTGVSVKALRSSYCNLANLPDETGTDPADKNKGKKSSFSKFDQLSKKTVLHVRSVDSSKAQKQFNQSTEAAPEQTSNCKSCGKQVFQMEQVKAERAVWHKNCFRCKECNKQLTVDIYQSHEGQLYCKPHFRELFKPKAVLDEEPELPRLRKPEMIIRENQPIELPPEVVRASDKPDLGLEELSSLNVKSRYQVFEKADGPGDAELERSPSSVSVKRSPSILSKLARFQAKGMDIGVTDDSLNGIPYEETSSSSDEEEEADREGGETDKDLIRSNRKQRERPVSFSKMEDVKSRWEQGQQAWREEQRQERKQEIQHIRSRLFLGKQGKMKEMYEQAVKESENPSTKKEVGIGSDKAKSIKEKFERGEVVPDDEDGEEEILKKTVDEDMSVFEAGISKKSRSLFLELDASAAKTQQQTPVSPIKTPQIKDDVRRKSRETIFLRTPSEDVVKSSDAVEEVKVETAEITNKFKFFETFKEPEKERKKFRITPPREGQVKENSPEREIYRDPDVVRAEDKMVDEEVMKTNTAKKMLSIFRQMEENATKEEIPEGPKPLKRFTPPPDYTRDSETSEEETESDEEEEEEDEEDGDPNIIRASDKIEDEFLKQAQNAARAKTLRAKFERWEEKENKANANAATNASHAVGNLNGSLELDQSSEHTSIDTTKSLRARFESLKNEAQTPKERTPRPKVNRFVEIQTTCAEYCSVCEKKLYPLEKVETGGKLFHKQCFRCLQCNCVLRMETYTLNNGKLYCITHFKQLFIAKGNYEEGFGLDQHKRKWNNRTSHEDDLLNSIGNVTDH